MAGSGEYTAIADEQQEEQKEQFNLPEIIMKEGQSGTMKIPDYEKGITFLYASSDTKAIVVDGSGNVSPGSEVITGEAVITKELMYNYKIVDIKEYKLHSVIEAGSGYVADAAGNKVTSVAEEEIRYEITLDDPSIVTVESDGKSAKITAVKVGETTLTLTGYAGTMVFGKGSTEVKILPSGNTNSQPSEEPSTASEAPVQSTAPAISEAPVQSTTPAASEAPVQSTAPAISESPVQSTIPAPQLEGGDADGDGKVDLSDAQQILKAALKIADIEDEAILKAVDMDGNGKIELSDAQHVLKKALKIIE